MYFFSKKSILHSLHLLERKFQIIGFIKNIKPLKEVLQEKIVKSEAEFFLKMFLKCLKNPASCSYKLRSLKLGVMPIVLLFSYALFFCHHKSNA